MDNKESTLVFVLWIIGALIYIINFVQMIIAIVDKDMSMFIIKLIGVMTAFGSLITVWF